MKILVTFLLLLSLSMNIFSQEKKSIKKNSIFFIEMAFGGAFKNTGNDILGIHYQHKSNLYTFRYTELHNVSTKNGFFTLFVPVYPIIFIASPIKGNEYAVLYGKRFIKNDYSYSFSGGFSYTEFTDFPRNYQPNFEYSYVGFPFEINVRWFKPKKKKIKLLNLIPVGKPTAFSSSIGVKLFGDISKNSYIGLGLTFGFGYYKNYN